MALVHYACSNCGHWQPWFDQQQPLACPVCTDVRNALPEDGWDFRLVEEVGGTLQTTWTQVLPGILGFSCTPRFGLAGTGWLLQREHGNVAFEGAPVYSPAALSEIESRGGIAVLSSSHPHGFGALWQLAERFSPEVLIHREGLRFTKAFRVTWPVDDEHRVDDELSLHYLGGHYEGQMALYDRRNEAVFCGDALKVEFRDGRPEAISCHKGFHYQIPLSHDELRRYIDVFRRLPFRRVFTPFDFAEGVTQDHAIRLFERQLSGRPDTRPVPLTELEVSAA